MFILNIHGRAYLTFAESYNEPRTMISFERHDSSFGDFLYDLFWDDDKLEMIYCTNDYLDKALWTSTSKDDTEDKYIKNKEYIKNNDVHGFLTGDTGPGRRERRFIIESERRNMFGL